MEWVNGKDKGWGTPKTTALNHWKKISVWACFIMRLPPTQNFALECSLQLVGQLLQWQHYHPYTPSGHQKPHSRWPQFIPERLWHHVAPPSHGHTHERWWAKGKTHRVRCLEFQETSPWGFISSQGKKIFKLVSVRDTLSQLELTQNTMGGTDGDERALTQVRGEESFSQSYSLEHHLSMPQLSTELLPCPPTFFPLNTKELNNLLRYPSRHFKNNLCTFIFSCYNSGLKLSHDPTYLHEKITGHTLVPQKQKKKMYAGKE